MGKLKRYLHLFAEALVEKLPNWATICIAIFVWYFGILTVTHNNLEPWESHKRTVYDEWYPMFIWLPLRTMHGKFIWFTKGWINVIERPTRKTRKVTYGQGINAYTATEHVYRVQLIGMTEKDHTTMLLKQKLSAAI